MINVFKICVDDHECYLVQFIICDKVVGTVQLETVAQSADVYKLFVAPEYRQKGIGSRLVCACMDIAKDDGCKTLVLTIGKNNRDVLPFYEKLGFNFAMEWRDSGMWLLTYALGDS